MVIFGEDCATGPFLSKHFMKTADEHGNVQTVEVLDIKNSAAMRVRGTIHEMERIAKGTNLEKYLYHAIITINSEAGEKLTKEQWLHAADVLGAKLGYHNDTHQRIVVLHDKKERTHVHVLWGRTNLEKMKATDNLSWDYIKHEEVARQLEREFGHARVQGAFAEREGVERPERRPTRAEWRMQEKTGVKLADVKRDASEAWEKATNGQEFRDDMDQRGYVLARGDKRGFVLVDEGGGVHSVTRQLKGVTAKMVAEKMADIDIEKLPSVDQAKDMQKLREADRTRSSGEQHGMEAVPQKVQAEPTKRREWTKADTEQRKADRAAVDKVLGMLGTSSVEEIKKAAVEAFVVFAIDDGKLKACTARYAFELSPEQSEDMRSLRDVGDLHTVTKAKKVAYVAEQRGIIAFKTQAAFLKNLENGELGEHFRDHLKASGLTLIQDQWRELHVTNGKLKVPLEQLISDEDKRRYLPAIEQPVVRAEIENFQSKFRHITEEMRQEREAKWAARGKEIEDARQHRATSELGYKAADTAKTVVLNPARGIVTGVGLAANAGVGLLKPAVSFLIGFMDFIIPKTTPARETTNVRMLQTGPSHQFEVSAGQRAREYLNAATKHLIASDVSMQQTAMMHSKHVGADLQDAIRRAREARERERER